MINSQFYLLHLKPAEDPPPEDWPWREIISLERKARARLYAGPRCYLCSRPLACGQKQAHKTCERLVSAAKGTQL